MTNNNHVWMRIVTLLLVACGISAGAIFSLTSDEFKKMIGAGWARNIAVLVAPLGILSLLNYNMIVRQDKSILVNVELEMRIALAVYLFFLALTVPFAFQYDPNCRVFSLWCQSAGLLLPVVATGGVWCLFSFVFYTLWCSLRRPKK